MRLPHRPEASGRAVHEEVDGSDIGGQPGRRFFLLRHTDRRGGHTPFAQAGAETSDTSADAVKPDPGASWEDHSGRVGASVGDESTELVRLSNRSALHW